MPGTVTLTGTAGAGLAVTAVAFPNVDSVLIDFNKNLITMFKPGETVSPIAVAAAGTVVATKVGNLWTLTIS